MGTNLNGPVNTVSGGNPNLRPETSINNTLGVVFTPSFIPGLTASVDYYHVKIGNAIGTIGGNSHAAYQLCLESNLTSPYCNLIAAAAGIYQYHACQLPDPDHQSESERRDELARRL